MGATDSLSGVRDIRYSLNGGRKIKYQQQLNFNTPGAYAVRVTATDNVGIASEYSITIRIFDKTASPVLSSSDAGDY
jgi:hypothetical protein